MLAMGRPHWPTTVMPVAREKAHRSRPRPRLRRSEHERKPQIFPVAEKVFRAMLIRTNGNGQKPHVILLYPKTGLDFGSTVAPPHAMLAVAAPMLKAGYTVKILDQRVEPITEEILRSLITSDCLAVGISTMTGTQVYFSILLAKMVRTITDGKIPLVWGGCHPSVTPEQTLSHPLVDIVAIGEGDNTMLDLVEALGAKRSLIHVPGIMYKDGPDQVKTLPRPLLNVEELLPTPWELVEPEKYIHRDMYLRDRYRVLDIGQTSRGCPFDCVAESALVGTPHGLLKIEEAVQTGFLACPEGHEHELGPMRCSAGHEHLVTGLGFWPAVSNGERECVKVTLENGTAITVSPAHRVRMVHGENLAWKEAGQLEVGEYVALAVSENQVNKAVELSPPIIRHPARVKRVPSVPALLTEDVAWLIGFLIGDGCLSKASPNSLSFAVTAETKPLLERRLERCFGVRGVAAKIAGTDQCEQYWVHSQVVRQFFLQSVGMREDLKTVVPLSIRRSPRTIVQAFLDGLMAADGHVPRRGHPCLATSSETFAQEIAALSWWNGTPAAIRRLVYGPKAFRAGYSFQVSFCSPACFVVERAGSTCWASVIPMPRRYERRRGVWTRFPTAYNRKQAARSAVKYGPKRALVVRLEPSHPLLKAGYVYIPVRSLERTAPLRAWDVAACPTHQFSSSGVVLANCSFCSSASIRERKWRAMSVDKAFDMIAEHIRRFNLDGYWLRDDELYIKRKRAHAIFEKIIAAGIDACFYTSGTRCDVFAKATEDEVATMKRAGAYTLKFGAESGSQRILDLMQKGITVEQTLAANDRCRRHGIAPAFGLMIGYPTETFEEINQTIDLGYRLKRENPLAELETMAQYTPLPGTPDWHLALKHGLQPPQSLEEWANWNFDEYDLAGRKSPWYNYQERKHLGNISYLSILANSLDNVVTSLKNPLIRWPAKAIVKPASRYFKWRLATHRYRWMPELEAVRILREKIFYRSTFTFE